MQTVEDANKTRPTILYLHGAVGTRALDWRTQIYKIFSARVHANVLAIDYRGFGESTGMPTEAGLALDAHAAWDWLIAHGARAEDVLVVGHSIGTGVASGLAVQLSRAGVRARGLVLIAPFSSLRAFVQMYSICGFPVLQPLQAFTWARSERGACLGVIDTDIIRIAGFASTAVLDAFDTLSVIRVRGPCHVHAPKY